MSEESLILLGKLVERTEKQEKEIQRLTNKVIELERSASFNLIVIKRMLGLLIDG